MCYRRVAELPSHAPFDGELRQNNGEERQNNGRTTAEPSPSCADYLGSETSLMTGCIIGAIAELPSHSPSDGPHRQNNGEQRQKNSRTTTEPSRSFADYLGSEVLLMTVCVIDTMAELPSHAPLGREHRRKNVSTVVERQRDKGGTIVQLLRPSRKHIFLMTRCYRRDD